MRLVTFRPARLDTDRLGALLGEDQRSRDEHASGEERDEQDAYRLGAHRVTLRAHYARVIAEE